MFVVTTDFTGFYAISNGTTNQDDKLDVYIDSSEPKFLRDLLGCDLYDLFITDFNITGTEPTEQRFKDIYDAFCVDDTIGSGVQRRSEGMVEMLKGFIYFNIVRDSDYFNTISGNVKNEFSNSTSVSTVQMGLTERYNVALGTYWNIQWFICDNASTYPEYNGLNKDVLGWL